MNNKSASSIDLIVLGFLLDKAMNAYELTNHIVVNQVGRFLKISPPAVYKSCKRLHREGFLEGEKIKEGEQPEKTIYRITANGKKRFLFLMERFSSTFTPYFLDCNAFVWNIEKVGGKQGQKMLKNLHDELLKLNTWIIRHEKEESGNASFAGRSIVKQYRMIISTLLIWSKEIIKDYITYK